MITKENLISIVSRDTGYSSGMVRNIVESTMRNITNMVSKGHKVQFSGFGTFEPKRRAARTGRNPHTNEPVRIPERVLPVFKPSKDFKESLSGLSDKK